MSAGKTLPQRLSAFAKKCGESHGFDAVGITDAHFDERTADRLKAFVAKGHHGSMGWMRETLERRQSPIHLWPEAKSIIMLALNYGPESNPLDALEEKSNGVISVYARNRDYHDIIKGRLKTMASQLLGHAKASGVEGDVKVFVDTAPVMENPLA